MRIWRTKRYILNIRYLPSRVFDKEAEDKALEQAAGKAAQTTTHRTMKISLANPTAMHDDSTSKSKYQRAKDEPIRLPEEIVPSH